MQNGRHRFYNFAMDTLDPNYLLEKLDVVFSSPKCAAKPKVASDFVLRNVEEGSCRYYYAHEYNTILERSKLVATTEDLTKIKKLLSNTDIIELCTRERANTKWKLCRSTKATLFAKLPKLVPMGCKDIVLPDSLLKTHANKSSTLEENTRKPYKDNKCPFRALALHLH